jgi:hypothetical protein
MVFGMLVIKKKIEDKDLEDDRVINNATISIKEYQLATQATSDELNKANHNTTTLHKPRFRTPTNKQWNRPNEGTIKVNCDANLSREGRWGLGATYRDSSGELLAAATWVVPGAEDPAMAEACVLYQAVRLAQECCFLDVIFESDNSSIIQLVHDGRNPRNYVGSFIRGIHCIKGYFRNCSFRHIGRKANQAAHCLALLAHDEPNRVWIEETPPQLVSVLLMDLIHQ